jgi:hypothetical protein
MEDVNASGIIRHPMGGAFEGETLFRTVISLYIQEIYAIVSSTQAQHRRVAIVWGVCSFPLGVAPPANTGPQTTPDKDWILTGQMRPILQDYIWDSGGNTTSGFASWSINPDTVESQARRIAPAAGHQYWVFAEGAGTDAIEVGLNQSGRLWYRQLFEEAA